MRPYFAIIKDSFRAAMASKVLYVLLILITLLLIALVPLHVKETLDWQLTPEVVKNPAQLFSKLVEKRESSKSVGRIWAFLSSDIKKNLLERLGEAGEKKSRRKGESEIAEEILLQQRLISELNSIIEKKDFYREDDWSGRRNINPEVKDLINDGVGQLSEIRTKRLNRLLVATALSPSIEAGSPTEIKLHYAIWEVPFPVPIQMTRQQFAQAMVSQLPYYFDKFVLSIGVFIAILVTCNMVPETFEPGSLNLLLSKPISRWGLYVSKFFGGCVFIGLCAAYLFIGVWLWLGIQMGVWDRAILFSIPLYVVVFAIYFSVSAFVGLLWRSPIVAVILTLMFWAVCFSVGVIHGFSKRQMAEKEMLAVVAADKNFVAIDLQHQINGWDESKQAWNEIHKLELDDNDKMFIAINRAMAPLRNHPNLPTLREFIKPIYDSRSKRILTSQLEIPTSTGYKPFFVSDEQGSSFKKIGRFPRETMRIWEGKEGIVAATGSGQFFRLNQERFQEALATSETSKQDEPKPSSPSVLAQIVGGVKKVETELFDSAGPDDPSEFSNRNQIDYSPIRDEFAVYTGEDIKIYQRQGADYQFKEKLDLELDFKISMTTMLAFGADKLTLAFGNGSVCVVNMNDGKSILQQLERRSGIQETFCSNDGKYFAILYRNGNLWTCDSANETEFVLSDITGQGQISSFGFGENGRCFIGYDSDRVAEYDLVARMQQQNFAPGGGFFSQAYRYAIRPLYRVFPKPGEFYKVVTSLASSSDMSINKSVDLNVSNDMPDTWGPLWSGLGFMSVMLALGCAVFHFRDY